MLSSGSLKMGQRRCVVTHVISCTVVFNFKTGFKPKTWLSLRPFVNTSPVFANKS